MALSTRRRLEIDAELQQVRDYFAALSSELASTEDDKGDLAFVSKTSAHISDHIEHLRRLLAIVQGTERHYHWMGRVSGRRCGGFSEVKHGTI